MKNIFHVWLNSLVLSYIGFAYGLGIWSIIQSQWLLNIVGVVLIVHALMISAIMTHEFIHGTIFQQRPLNELFGKIMTHINGACYTSYKTIAQNHFHHHVWHVDLVPFDYGEFVKSFPPIIRKFCIALEWCYFPIFEFILRWRYIVAPFLNKTDQRWRVLACLAYRGTLFSILAWISVKALILYGVAYLGFVMFLRLVDTFHHTYEYWVVGVEPPKRDRIYEQANTFSNVISGRFRWLNLIYLNFGYHNTHHHDMRSPWYKLPELHERLYGNAANNLLPFSQMAGNYHRFRVARLLGSEQGDSTNANSLTDFAGAIGLSFLTPP